MSRCPGHVTVWNSYDTKIQCDIQNIHEF
jgi:hypothetical protein